MTTLKVLRITQTAQIPTYATDGSACFDIYADNSITIPDHKSGIIRTGISVEVPHGYVMQVYPRSGLAFSRDVTLSNSVGIIDSNFRGEVYVKLINHGSEPIHILHGDRIAQAMLKLIDHTTIIEVDGLSRTNRSGGFGSTGR